MEEEAKVRFGVDGGSLNASLRGVEHAFEQTGEKVKDIFHEVGHHLTSIFATGAVIAQIERTLSVAQRLVRQSESLGTSTDFLQDITNVGRAAGLSAEQIEKMLNKFASSLPKGADLEEEFFKIADSIHAIDDPATRVGIAVDYFGKKVGPQFVSTLARGREGIKEFAAEFQKLSRGEIKNLEEAKLAIEKAENFGMVFLGRAINVGTFVRKMLEDFAAFEKSGFRRMGRSAWEFVGETNAADRARDRRDATGSFSNSALINYKDYLDDLILKSKASSFEQKMEVLKRRKEFEEHQVNVAKTEEDRYAHLKKVKELEIAILDLNEQQAKKVDEAAEKRAKEGALYHKQVVRVEDAERELNDVRKKPYEFSLEELAGAGVWGGGGSGWGARSFGFHQPVGARIARQILNLQSRAKEAFEWGNIGTGEVLRRRADQMFDSLAASNPYLVNPQERAARALEKQQQILNDWRDNGVPVVSAED